MRNEKGMIGVFTLLAMLFFLIFIMVAYSNIASKIRTQVETTGVLVDEYKSDSDSSAVLSEMMAGDASDDVVKTDDESGVLSKTGKYIAIKGKIYNIP